MTENKFNFTDNRLRNIQPVPDKKRSYFYDTKTDGLRLQITAAGTLSFQFQTWDTARKKPVTKSLGKYPKLSITAARKKAVNEMAAVNDGHDIESDAQKIRDEDRFDAIFELWMEQFSKPHKSSWREDERRFNLYIKKPLGKKKLSWFTPTRIRQWHRGITLLQKQRGNEGETVSPSTANRALTLITTVFNQITPDLPNPCRGVKKFRETSRDRFLQPNELKSFFKALYHADTPELLRDYVLISLFTGARRSNVLSMRWNEISFDRLIWTVPAQKSKNSEPMSIPLVIDTLKILERRKKNSRSVFVFPGNGKTGHYGEPKRAWGTMTKRAGLIDVRLHDLRRTMGSWQTMTGASSTIVGKTLGHKSPEATAVYARLNLDPVRASMETAVKAMLATKDLPEKVISIGGTSGHQHQKSTATNTL
ncbi:MAG: tyrosine-type recombinase/integrase [Proteobacteria bacterium]|nr:tyrosine-type recombinase/integrase [Pseudomonadota bacterium]